MFTGRTVVTHRASSAKRTSQLIKAVGAAISVGALAGSAQAQFVWTAGASGNFSAGMNWLGNAAPPLGNSATTLSFTPIGNAAVTATNDLGTPFLLNSMTFNSASTFTVAASPTTNLFQFAGTGPSITKQGVGNSVINPGVRLAGNAVVNADGMGNLTFGGVVSDDSTTSGFNRSLTINSSPIAQLSNQVLFSGSNTYTGGLTLNGANVLLNGFGAANGFGPAGSTVNIGPAGACIGQTSNITPSVGTYNVSGPLRVVSATIGYKFANSVLTGSGPITLNTNSNASLDSNSDAYTGTITLDRFDMPENTGAGSLALSGSNGSLGGVTTMNVRAGNTLQVNDTGAQKVNRFNTNLSLNLQSGNFAVFGPTSALVGAVDALQTVGAVAGSGYSTFTAQPNTNTTVSTTISMASLSRVDNGTFCFRGRDLGGSGDAAGATANTGYIHIGSPPSTALVGGGGAAGTPNVSILPYAIGDTSPSGSQTNGTTLVTITANNTVRALNVATEFAPDLLMTSGATENVRLTASTPNANPVTVNSLVLSSTGGVTGAGSVSVTSGTILNTAASGSISNTLAFGTAEANIFAIYASTVPAPTLTISGNMTGSGGLTKSGGGILALTGDNSGLTGQLTHNSGVINFNSAAALPGTGAIVVNGGAGGAAASTTGQTVLNYSGGSSLDISRDVAVNGWLGLTSSGSAGLTLSGQVSGSGGLFISSPGPVTLSGNNTYTGPTNIASSASATFIASDASLGNGGGLNLSGAGGLALNGNWTTNRLVNQSATSTINTNGFDATLNGPFTNYSANAITGNAIVTLNKTGAGTLAINTTDTTWTGALNVNGGAVLVNGLLAASTSAVTVNTGGTLGGSGTIYRNITVALGGTLSPGSSAGVLTQFGNPTFAAGSTFLVDLNGPMLGAQYDQLSVGAGVVTLGGATLAVNLGYAPAASDMFFILSNDGTDAIAGTFAGLVEGSSVALGSWGGDDYTATISYLGDFATGTVGLGNDVVLYNIVPAPGAAGLLVLAGLLARGRRRGF